MRYLTHHIILCLFLALSGAITHAGNTYPPTPPLGQLIDEWIKEQQQVYMFYNEIERDIQHQLNANRDSINSTSSTALLVKNLIHQNRLKENLNQNALAAQADKSKVRYLKGLEIIKILYEKLLTLDHHFASITSFNEINSIANPNHYTEFKSWTKEMQQSQPKKEGFELSALLGDNIYANIVHSMVSLFTTSKLDKGEKEAQLKEVQCVLDFTLNMHQELNTIYFETAFLQKSNTNTRQELANLFDDFTKPIQYQKSLEKVRNNDEWDEVKVKLNNYITNMHKVIQDPAKQNMAYKMQINLEFPINQLVQFLHVYNAFINQGTQFYQKFEIMLNSYPNEQLCNEKLPKEFNMLKNNIAIAIDKFTTAYKPIEINGSKLKEVLYGIHDYE